MLNKTRKLLGKLRFWKRIVWNAEKHFNIPLITRIKFALRGFMVDEVVLFDLENNDYHEYISEYERMQSREINGAYKFILDDKLVFEEVFAKYVKVPVNYAWVKDGHIYPLHGYNIDENNIYSFLLDSKATVFKYLDRGGGHGTYVFQKQGDVIYANGRPADEKTIISIFKRNGTSVLCEYITQSEFSSSLYPETTNTIRIVCAKCKNEVNSDIITAVQRIGRKSSIPVDNFCSGGMVSMINIDTGELSDAIAGLGEENTRMIHYSQHPDTGEVITGKIIPDWNNLKKRIIDLTNSVPYLNFVAWDVLLTPNGFCIIEGNASSSCNLLQMYSGYANTKLGKIYGSYGYKAGGEIRK